MTEEELTRRLGEQAPPIDELVAMGLPCDVIAGERHFSLRKVNRWLLENGFAERRTENEQICKTYVELAAALGMGGANPERVIANWVKQPGFPGRAGKPGKADAFLPVAAIREWLESREKKAGGRGIGDDDELRELERQRRKLLVQLETQNLQEQLGRLADVEEIARFNRQCVANAVAIMEPLADEVVLLLPSDTPAAIRSAVHGKVTELLDNARLAIAEIIDGDTDEESEDEDAGGRDETGDE